MSKKLKCMKPISTNAPNVCETPLLFLPQISINIGRQTTGQFSSAIPWNPNSATKEKIY